MYTHKDHPPRPPAARLPGLRQWEEYFFQLAIHHHCSLGADTGLFVRLPEYPIIFSLMVNGELLTPPEHTQNAQNETGNSVMPPPPPHHHLLEKTFDAFPST